MRRPPSRSTCRRRSAGASPIRSPPYARIWTTSPCGGRHFAISSSASATVRMCGSVSGIRGSRTRRHGVTWMRSLSTAADMICENSRYDCRTRDGLKPRPVSEATHSPTMIGRTAATGISPNRGSSFVLSSDSYVARVFTLRCGRTEAYQRSAHSATVCSPARGSTHFPRAMSASASDSHRSASRFVANVSGAGRSIPSGPGCRAWNRPEGSFRTRPNRRLPVIGPSTPSTAGRGSARPGRQLRRHRGPTRRSGHAGRAG